MTLAVYYPLQKIGDERGALYPIEAEIDVPFQIKRSYFMRDLSTESPRGFHAHKELRQVAFCVAGSCRILLHNGLIEEWVKLEEPQTGLLIDRLIWHEMYDFQKIVCYLFLQVTTSMRKITFEILTSLNTQFLRSLSWYRCQMKVCKVRVSVMQTLGGTSA